MDLYAGAAGEVMRGVDMGWEVDLDVVSMKKRI